MTIAALERGLHVLVEKPLAYTLRETDEVIAAAERAGKTLMVGMMKQYDPGYRARGRAGAATARPPLRRGYDAGAGGHALHAHHPIVRSAAPGQAEEERYGEEMFRGMQRRASWPASRSTSCAKRPEAMIPAC